MDVFDAEDLFGNIVGNPDDIIENPNETKDYKITIDYKRPHKRSSQGRLIKMVCRMLLRSLQMRYLISYVFMVGERYLTHLCMVK